jgi:hypothetical protein
VKTLARAGLPLLVVLALVALALAPLGSPASARLAPSLSVDIGNPDLPRMIPLSTDELGSDDLFVYVTVAGGPATNVTVSASGTGLLVSTPQNIGTLSGDGYASIGVSAQTGGFHQLTVTVTADGAAPVASTLNYVWAPTGALTVSAGQDFQYTYFGTTGLSSENGTSFPDRAELLFLTQDTAFYGVPIGGLPKCKTGSTTATEGCLKYAYDKDTGLIQIGGSIGYVDKKGIHTQGLGLADLQDGENYAHRDWSVQLQFPNTHNRYAGTWSWKYDNYPNTSPLFVTLTLRKNGTFVLSDDWRKKETLKGKYAISHFGRMVLTGNFGHQVHNFGVFLTKAGKPAPQVGLALGFGTKKDNTVVFLAPKKKK